MTGGNTMPDAGLGFKELIAIAAFALSVIGTALGAIVYASTWKDKKDVTGMLREIEALKFKLLRLERRSEDDLYIIDIVAGILKNTSFRISVISSDIDDLWSYSKGKRSPVSEREYEKLSVRFERFRAELGLFSATSERRISAQRSLAHLDGDHESLELMRGIEKGSFGTRDPDIVSNIGILKARLRAIEDEFSERYRSGEF